VPSGKPAELSGTRCPCSSMACWAHHLLSRSVTETVGVFDWRKLEFLRMGLKLAPAHSGVGGAARSLMTLVISLHALHHLFVAGKGWS
jgi:hypothetical protein